jgi:hypothetical protein
MHNLEPKTQPDPDRSDALRQVFDRKTALLRSLKAAAADQPQESTALDPQPLPDSYRPSLNEALEASRFLSGEAAQIVRRFLEQLPNARRPPLDLRPLVFAIEERMAEVHGAIRRQEACRLEPPAAWVREQAVLVFFHDLLQRAER